MWLLWLVNGIVFLAWFVSALRFRRYLPAALHLTRVPPDGPEPLPRLSVVVAARNEAGAAEAALRTLLALEYPDLEVIGVDDRSTDGTGAILDRLAAGDGRLRVVRVRELPPGWLGKTHALHVGARRATGAYLLFTDADVHFEPTALRRAVRAAIRRELDHLVLLPEVVVRGFWETLFAASFGTAFLCSFPPWRVADPRSKTSVGVGAFNLVRAEAYRRAGGHAALALEVVDDLKLGKRLKLSGARQECGHSAGLVRVRWAEGVRGMVENLTKNAFAVFGYAPGATLANVAMILVLVAWPALGLWLGAWGPRLLCAGALASMAWTVRTVRPVPGASLLHGLAFPLGGLIMAYTILRSMARTYRQGGIVWRGTFYPLEELRKGVV